MLLSLMQPCSESGQEFHKQCELEKRTEWFGNLKNEIIKIMKKKNELDSSDPATDAQGHRSCQVLSVCDKQKKSQK